MRYRAHEAGVREILGNHLPERLSAYCLAHLAASTQIPSRTWRISQLSSGTSELTERLLISGPPKPTLAGAGRADLRELL